MRKFHFSFFLTSSGARNTERGKSNCQQTTPITRTLAANNTFRLTKKPISVDDIFPKMASRKLSSSSSSPSFMLPLVRPGSFGTLMRVMMMMMITTMIPCQQVNFVGGLAAVPMPSLDNNKMEDYIPLAEEAMQYFDASPDPFHVVQTSWVQKNTNKQTKHKKRTLIPSCEEGGGKSKE